MKLAFKSAKGGSVTDRAIAWWTKSPYCHVELVFDRVFPGSPLPICFSSTLQTGCRVDWVDLSNPAMWTILNLDVPTETENDALRFAQTFHGERYDRRGILEFVLRNISDNAHEQFCSEVVTRVLQHVGLFKGLPPDQVSPGLLYDVASAL